MDYFESKMEMALAEILGVSSDTIEMLNLTIENNIGNDDCFYGYYVKFPKKSDIDTSTLSTLEQSDIEKIPWGVTKDYTEGDFANTSVDPFGYKAEWENEYCYLFTSVSKEDIINEITKIIDKIKSETDTLIIKSLLIFAFDIVESYTRSFVINAIPEAEKNPLNYKNIFHKISSTNDRINLYKQYTNKTLNYIPYYQDIRNALAHDILNCDISYPTIITFNKNGEQVQTNIENITSELLKYIMNPTSND